MAKHLDPESCVIHREVYGEALTGETSRPAIEPRNHESGAPTLLWAHRSRVLRTIRRLMPKRGGELILASDEQTFFCDLL